MNRKLSFLVWLIWVPCLLFAQSSPYSFSTIDITQGLSHNQVNSILKDEQGFVWFGTMSGLNRYDGYEIKTYKHNINDTSSISDDYITRIVQGPDHRLWIATRNGWNVYNPATEKFVHTLQPLLQKIGISNAGFTDIKKDQKGNYWFVHPQEGLYQYEPRSGKTVHFYLQPANASSLSSNNVTSIAETTTGDIWIVYGNGKLDKMDGHSYKVIYRTGITDIRLSSQIFDYSLFADAQNDLWIYTNNNSNGLFYVDHNTNAISHFKKETGKVHLSSNIIYGIVQDNNSQIWIATDHGGITIIDKKDFSVRYLLHNEADNKSISQNSIYSIYKDNTGIVWIGTFKKGINYFHPDNLKFPLFRHVPANPNSLPYDDVNCFVEDAKGNIWIGTNGGGLMYYNRITGKFTQYLNNPTDPNSISNNVIVSLCIDHKQQLWVGTYYGGLNRFDGKKFIHYRHKENDPGSIADDRIWEIMEDSKNRLWIGTLVEGLDLFDQGKNTFIHHKPSMPNSVHSGYIPVLVEDKNGNIWIGTSEGVDVLIDRTGKIEHYTHVPNDRSSLSNNSVISMVKDDRGWIWVGTREGLTIFNQDRKIIKTLRMEDGLPDNTITTILKDHHSMWLSTPNGLSHIVIANDASGHPSFTFKNYDETDGLQGREFNEGAALTTKNGELIFGGGSGFNLFFPDHITTSNMAPDLVLTDLQVFNKSVTIGERYKNNIILPQSITLAKEIRLKYNQDVFSIEFAALNYCNAEKIKYAYILEGFNDEWLITDSKNRKATFTNLSPGTYTFKVKAINEDGVWSDKALALKVQVLPPFWRTPLAYILYLLLVVAALLYGRYHIIRRARLRFILEQERKEIQRLHELDMMKTRFFTNVSHEFRTPLSLIITPLEKMIRQADNHSEKKQYHLIYRNARRLLNLVNQLLDFRKMETQELKLMPAEGDMIQFIKELSYSFTDIAENKKIAFSFTTTTPSFNTTFDHDKIERVVFNLLSNAFKFTHEGGEVSVSLCLQPSNNSAQLLELTIKDTGIGIEKEKQDKIFERYFQNNIPGSIINQGSGIGLAITKEFVRLHHGTIQVDSEPDKGSCFTVTLPVISIPKAVATSTPPIEMVEMAEEPEFETMQAVQQPEKFSDKKKTLLLIEDNEDFRFYLKDNLKEYYNVVEAANGKAGWHKALSSHPDLVISDISMPEMNGMEFCKKIKGDKRTSFIPVILLTAFSGEEQQIKGLETGANDYLTKPFNFEILQSKIKNLLQQQERFKKTYQKQVSAAPTEVVIENADEKFIQEALAIVEKKIANPDFSVEELSRELFLSRVALYKKLLALTGKTPIEFIRSLRLKRAAQLLEQSQLTIAEVAYEVGFNNPKYFTKYFKAEFDILPSAYAAKKTSAVKQDEREGVV